MSNQWCVCVVMYVLQVMGYVAAFNFSTPAAIVITETLVDVPFIHTVDEEHLLTAAHVSS